MRNLEKRKEKKVIMDTLHEHHTNCEARNDEE